ncbi:MAG: LptA/OstA family protein [Pararhodobacter sp.]|nr:LptA/OstA family protein [Pararhodobacter sp.]
MARALLVKPLALALCLLGLTVAHIGEHGSARAQDTQIRLGESLRLSGRQLEVTADTLEVDQESGLTIFSGNVLAVQGALRLGAERMQIEYRAGADGESRRIQRLVASGSVTLVTANEAVEAQEAIYLLGAQTLEMQGDVVFVQGENVLSGDRFTADLSAGTGRMQGRVRTIIRMD